MCLELTIYSGHRQPHTSIGQARYRIVNGPIFAGKIAVKSCSMYNTTPPISISRNTLRFRQSGGPGDSQGLLEIEIPAGEYTGDQLSEALAIKLGTILNPTPSAQVMVYYNPITRKMEFTFDEIYDYEYAESYEQRLVTSAGFYAMWQYEDSSGTRHVANTHLDAVGTYLLSDWLAYCSTVFTDAHKYLKTRSAPQQTSSLVWIRSRCRPRLKHHFQEHSSKLSELTLYQTTFCSVWMVPE